jgi:hypothetical protein
LRAVYFIVIRHSRPFPFRATSRFDKLKAQRLPKGTSPARLAGFVIAFSSAMVKRLPPPQGVNSI